MATLANTSGLRAATEEKRIRKRRAVEAAIQDMRHAGEAITFKTIAEKAGVSREYLYQNFKADIEQLRTATHNRRIEMEGEPVPMRTARRSATIEAALRNKITRLEEEATELRKQKTALERRYERALGEAEEWRQRHQRALAELLELRGRLIRNDG
ncbi:DUF6262 family protein [Azospirillum rugosum]|uniref:AraC-like DNA-binding protein n=1 Tax=Azospirillum rugosum TaxID=416170 RepID=A0ABS4SZB3_9PROT|nr:DUF6262 family protein [Azospirillum rugosum]MBP2297307.1 AraC-like DNA-binding protein [Azospirillum rugosum]MDQ0531151.1 AraC-like DNA-binding protein [Azospirillum rugosum]